MTSRQMRVRRTVAAVAAAGGGVALGMLLRRVEKTRAAARGRRYELSINEEIRAEDQLDAYGIAPAIPLADRFLDGLRDVRALWRALRWRFPEDAEAILGALRPPRGRSGRAIRA